MRKVTILNLSLLLIMFLLIFGVMSCKKLDDVNSLGGFSVAASKTSCSIGDTIVFSINQNADVILFYSGKPGFNVNNRNRNSGVGTDILNFQTSLSQASTKNNGDTILLKISNNLKSYDSIGVANATWTDITSLAKWPSVTTTGFVRSGAIDISGFNNFDSVYIAFQVVGKQNPLTAQRKWQIQGFTLSNSLPDGTFTPLFAPVFTSIPNPATDTLPSFVNVGWTQVNMYFWQHPINYYATNYGTWNVGDYGYSASNSPIVLNNKACNLSGVVLATNYPVTFDPSNVKNTPNTEGWLISSPVNLNLVRRDFPTLELKDEVRTPAKGFRYVSSNGTFATYSLVIDSTFKSGQTYDMGFVAQNRNVNQSNEVVKHISIKIN